MKEVFQRYVRYIKRIARLFKPLPSGGVGVGFFLIFTLSMQARVGVDCLRVENLTEPLGIATLQPHFSWQLTSDKRDVVQTGYHIIVSSDDGTELWNTGRVESSDQLWIGYGGTPLKSGQHLTWRVQVFTNKGTTAWSNDQHFSTGLLKETEWGGRWIGLEHMQDGEVAGQTHSRLAARYLRQVFTTQSKPIRRATAYVAGLGFYRLFIGEEEIGAADVLKPAPSDYRKTIYYNTYDVTAAVSRSRSFAVGIIVGNGKYFAPRQDKPYKNATFGLPKCRMNIVVEYADGSTQRLVTDEKWRVTANGPIRANNEYDGEEYDARMELDGWLRTDYNDSLWLPAERTALPQGTLCPQMTPPIVPIDTIVPIVTIVPIDTIATIKTIATISPKTVYDFGQNIAGWVSFKPAGNAGDTIRVRYAERLNADGSLYVENLRNARSEDIYICGSSPTSATWHPSFVYHGFRYVEVTGPAIDVKAWLVADKMNETGTFECSDTILNKVMRNARWGIIDNYKGMPVDCPQRNERQPWLGDRAVGSLGESFIVEGERLYTKWMRDICESQRSDGCIPDVAPAFWNYYTDNVTWPAVLPITCDMLWRQYGNTQPIVDAYPSIRRWVMHIVEEYSQDGIIGRDRYGDWCMPPEKLELIHSEDPERKTDGALLSTAYMVHILKLMATWSDSILCNDEGARWRDMAATMTDAFNRRFLTVRRGTSPRPGHALYPDSVYYGNNTATANILPLAFGMVPDDCRDDVVKNVVQNICIKNNNHVSCGVIGISWLLRTLSAAGRADVAYLLATQKTYPSWGYMTENGATTIWELWNGDKANAWMNSGNHVMLLGDLLSWCYMHLAGIRQAEGSVAYRHIVLKPDFTIQNCEWVDATYATPYGKVASRWRKTLQHLTWDVEIPCNTQATLVLPSGEERMLGSGRHSIDVAIPTADPRIITDEFTYSKAPFLSPHASTIVETRRGDLVCAYFAGTYERNPDCCIYVDIKEKGSKNGWCDPILAADGVFSDTLRMACWNPVLTEMPGGELWLFYKIGKSVSGWTGWLAKSKDGGRTWSPREPLPDGFLGPIKNKPLLLGDKLLCPSSTEVGGWRFHVEIYDLKTGQWRYVGPVESTLASPTNDPSALKPIECIQPSILQLSDGRLQVLMRTRNGRIATSYSSDEGETWTPVTLTDVPNNQSGTDAVTLRDGRHVLVYNDFATLPGTPKGPRTPLSLAVSSDGTTWQHVMTLEDSPIGQYSYPAIIEGSDGTLHITYTWRRQRVAYKQVRLP